MTPNTDYGTRVWRCLRSIMDDQDSYDLKLDHIYEMAAAALGYLDAVSPNDE